MYYRRGRPAPYCPIACADSVKPETGAASSCSTRPELLNVAETTYETSPIAERVNTRCDVDLAGEKFRNPVVELNVGTAIRLIGEKRPDYDPFCGWCYANAPALKALAEVRPHLKRFDLRKSMINENCTYRRIG